MVEDYDSIVHNSVWDVVPRPDDKLVVNSCWLYKVNQAIDGSVEKHMARFVACGFSQVEGIDYDETFASVTRIDNYFTEGLGFTKSEVDANLYHIVVEGKLLIIGLYVDDLILTVNQLSQVMVRPTMLYWIVEKHVLRYLRGTSQYGLWYRKTEGVKLQGFTDVDWAGSPSIQKITSGRIFSIGSAIVSWYSRKQRLIALSSVEALYMDASQEACEAIWMRKILVGLFGHHMDTTVIYYDNHSCIKLYENLVFHDQSMHIDIQYHHLGDCVLRRIMLLEYIPTKEKDAKILTKALSRCKFEIHRDRIGVADNPFLVEREC
eukprot:PITA_05583